MNKKISSLLITLLFVFSTGCPTPQESQTPFKRTYFDISTLEQNRFIDPVFSEVESELDIIYKTTQDYQGNPVDLGLDIFWPAADSIETRPLIVIIHGGGFVVGHRSEGRPLAYNLAELGYTAATISYRLRDWPITDYRQNSIDVKEDAGDAIRWLQNHSTDYGINTRYIGLWGWSAGAALAVNMGYGHWGDEGILNTDYFGIVAMAGYGLWDTTPRATDPPIFMIHGSLESQLYVHNPASNLQSSLSSLGIDSVVHSIEGMPHNTAGFGIIPGTRGKYQLYRFLTGENPPFTLPADEEMLLNLVQERLTSGETITIPQVDCTINGDLSEWNAQTWLSFNQLKDNGTALPEESDFTASGVLAWNPDEPSTLYGAVEITDDTWITNLEENNEYDLRNDTVELIIDFSTDTELEEKLRWYMILSEEEEDLFSSGSGDPAVASALSYSVNRSGQTTQLEFALDFSALETAGFPESIHGYRCGTERIIGVSLMANDVDTSQGSQEHQIGIISGGSFERDNFMNLLFQESP